MSLLRRPRFDFGTDVWEALLPAMPWTPRDRTVGGHVVSQAGIPASYVVRRDVLLDLTLRFWEAEWPMVAELVAFGQTCQPFLWWPDASVDETIVAYLETPAAGDRWSPARSSDFPRVFELGLTLRAASSDSLWRQYFELEDVVTVQGDPVTVGGELVTVTT